jgi:benzylsuccinate CoA-transferase BbsE subunit
MTGVIDLPLAGVRVVDVTDRLGRYPGRLFADLGAEVVRVQVPGSRAAELEGAELDADFVFSILVQRLVELDPDRPADAAELEELLADADLLITDEGPAALAARGLDPVALAARHPRLVHVAMSPYGLDGPWADRPATDLTLLAAGGLLQLAGTPDRAPVRPAGEQSGIATGLHAAVGALLALYERGGSGAGQVVDVSAQQAVAHSLENAVQYVDLEGVVRGRTAGTATEVANGLFRCRDGWIYLVAGIGGTPLGWDGLIGWLAGAGVEVDELATSRWQDAAWRRTLEAADEFRLIFEAFTATRDKAELYEAGQRHGVSLAPVATPADLLESPQLAARGFFRDVDVAGRRVTVPGPPYRFAGMDVGPRGRTSSAG